MTSEIDLLPLIIKIDNENAATLVLAKDIQIQLDRHIACCEMLARARDEEKRREEKEKKEKIENIALKLNKWGNLPVWIMILLSGSSLGLSVLVFIYTFLKNKD
jgi:hypothetical protein